MALVSLQVEKHALSGLVKFPEILADVEGFHSEKDYSNEVHYTLFCILRDCFLKNEKIDKVLLAERAKNLGIKFKDDIDIFEYIEAICLNSVTKDMTKKSIKELIKLRVKRELVETAQEIIKYADKCNEDSIEKIITGADKIYNENISIYEKTNQPENLFSGIDELIIERGNNPVPEMGLITPYKTFNNLYGGLRNGGIYAWVSRPKQGKMLALDTPILTTLGWKEAGEVKEGDFVYSVDGKPTKVLATKIWEDREMYKVTTDDRYSVVVGAEHEWTCRLRTDYGWKTYETETIFQWLEGNPERRRPRLPEIEALQFEGKNLLIHPYVLGYWLGNGTRKKGEITCHAQDAEWLRAKFQEFGYECKIVKYNSASENARTIRFKKLCSQLKELGVLDKKYIPEIYLFGSIEQRKLLLQGLVDSDGYIAPPNETNERGGICEFTNTNKELANQFTGLVHSLGVKAGLNTGRATLDGKDCGEKYRITFYYDESALLPRKTQYLKQSHPTKNHKSRHISIEKLSIKDKGICFQVDHPSKLFLCGKALIPTHNSTILNDMSVKMTVINENLHVLILDTEMYTQDMRFRTAASLTGVPVWWLETGNYRNNKEYYQKYEQNRHLLKLERNVQHLHCPGKPTKEIESIIRRWYYKIAGRGGRALIVYDYLKLTGESDKEKKEYQLIGEKVDSFKILSSTLNIPFLTACQLNRSADNGNEEGSAISQSDRLLWYANAVYLSRRKTLEEINDHGGPNFGTHLWKPIGTRFQGKNATGHFDKYKTKDAKGKVKYVDFYLNFNVDNFNVEERGSIIDVIEAQKLKPNIANNPHNDDTIL